MSSFDQQRQIEKLEVLAGERPKARHKAAVRIEDLAPLLQIPQMQAAAAAGAAPTADEYAALLKDTRQLHARLTEIATILQGRLL